MSSADELRRATEQAGGGEIRPRHFTIAEARLRVQESVEHLSVLGHDGYIVKGWSHLLAGWWRLGKTELMTAIVLVWLRLGLRVVWITEEPDTLRADRADMVDELYESVPWENLTLIDALSAPPAALLDDVAAMQWEVLILDTIEECCGIDDINDAAAVKRAMSPWQRRLRDGVRTVIYICQHRKAAGALGARILGSVALPSRIDVVLELEEVSGQERRRRLTVRRRRSSVAPLVYEMDDEDRILVIPDPRSRSRVEAEAMALKVVDEAPKPLSTLEVRRRLSPPPSRDTVARARLGLARQGHIRRDPPVSEPAERRTVKWLSNRAEQLPLQAPFQLLAQLPQNAAPIGGPFVAADPIAADEPVFEAWAWLQRTLASAPLTEVELVSSAIVDGVAEDVALGTLRAALDAGQMLEDRTERPYRYQLRAKP